MEKIKFRQYDVQWKNHEYTILIPQNTEHLLTYEDGDGYRGWVGDRKEVKNLMYAAAILGFNPIGKIIYFPIRKNTVPKEYFGVDQCDLLFTTHQVQLKRSEWKEIRNSLKYLQEKSYVFNYDENRTKEYFGESLSVWNRQEQNYKNTAKSWKKEELIEVLEEGTLFQVFSRKQFQQIYLNLHAFIQRNLEQELLKEQKNSCVPFEFMDLHFKEFWYRERKQVNRVFVDYYDEKVIQREKRFRERKKEND